MDPKIVVALIETVPSIIWATVVIALIVIFRRTISEKLLPRVSEIEAFGVKAKLIEELERAAQELPGNVQNLDQVAKRGERLAPIIQGAHILFATDTPMQMSGVINALRSLGVKVDIVTSTEDAFEKMSKYFYDVVISDMKIDNKIDGGIYFLDETVKRRIHRPTILTVGRFKPEKGIPPFAFGITDRVDNLLNLVFDVLERER